MSPGDIKHFLVILDPQLPEAIVEEFGNDVDRAVEAYGEREKEYREAGRADEVDIVLLGADSLETVKRTHSSYFGGDEHGFAPYFRDALAAS